jgi:hypothetical protein
MSTATSANRRIPAAEPPRYPAATPLDVRDVGGPRRGRRADRCRDRVGRRRGHPGRDHRDGRRALRPDLSMGAGTYTSDGLPPGLVINLSSGEVTGVPTQAGDFSTVISWRGPQVCSPPTDDEPGFCHQDGRFETVEIDVAPGALPRK